jgi:uncharacterized protein YdeI (YjbR/CyaY-like superfamily)
VEEAIAFGWIDSKANKRDKDSYFQYFARRQPRSSWSRENRQRAQKMIDLGLMTESGQAMIDLAQKTGRWEALEEAQTAVIPGDLQSEFSKYRKADQNFLAFPPSSKRIILEWILDAKTAVTRKKRIEETARLAAENIRVHHPRQQELPGKYI